MAPTPTEDTPTVEPSASAKPNPTYWTKANIAFTTVFALLFVAIVVALLAFFLHRRAQKKKYARPNTDKAALLDQEDRGSMFSRHRESSVTLYVDSADGQSKRVSQESTHLIPLQATHAYETRETMYNNTTESAGSGVSAASRTTSGTSLGSGMLTPVSPLPPSEESDLGVRPTRPRSTSSASQRMRYYDMTPSVTDMPPVPKIVHTPSH